MLYPLSYEGKGGLHVSGGWSQLARRFVVEAERAVDRQ